MATLAPAIMRLQHVGGIVHAAGDGDVGLDLVIEDRDPVQAQAQLVRAAEDQVRHDLQLLEVEVGLIEAVEDHEAVGAGFVQCVGKVRQRGEVGPELDGDGNLDLLANGPHQLDVLRLRAAAR